MKQKKLVSKFVTIKFSAKTTLKYVMLKTIVNSLFIKKILQNCYCH